jgi:EamA domain-containing membrane protein RarD
LYHQTTKQKNKMKKVDLIEVQSFVITLLWGAFPFVVKATEKQGSVDWFWFSIIWLVMGIAICFTTYFFYTIGKSQQKDIDQIRETLKKYS